MTEVNGTHPLLERILKQEGIFGSDDHEAAQQHVQDVTTTALQAIADVVRTAADLERLLVTNASRVSTEISGHVALAGLVRGEAQRLGEVIERLRQEQAALLKEND